MVLVVVLPNSTAVVLLVWEILNLNRLTILRPKASAKLTKWRLLLLPQSSAVVAGAKRNTNLIRSQDEETR